VSLEPLAVALRRRLDQRIALRDDAILRAPAYRAPGADREAAVERRVEGGPIDAGLAAEEDEAEGHGTFSRT